jgi:peptide/nickel transport system ATP-binding protein
VTAAPVLEVEGLRVEVDGTPLDIVDDVCFSVRAGEILALVGESGSGKTTVGLAVLGHTRRGARIAGGEVRIDGRDILARSAAERRALRGKTVSYVPQDPAASLNPALRIGVQLRETLAEHRYGVSEDERRARLGEMLAEVMLPSDPQFLKRYPHQLSGGQQQRVGLAMAFACRPRVIVLDEPTTGLDVTTQAHILETVRSLCAAHGVAALYISHDLAVVATLADHVAVMYAGRLVEVGAAGVLVGGSAHPYTRRLVEAIPEISGRHVLAGIPGSAPRPDTRPEGCFFAPRCAYRVDECTRAFPPTAAVSPTHSVRCYRYEDVLAASEQPRRLTTPRAATDGADPLLEVRGVDAAHGAHQVVFDVELAVAPRQCVALVGQSGSGKTTLARCIAGLHRSFTGEIAFRGVPLAPDARARDRETRRVIQYVFQSPYRSLNPRKTVGQILGQPVRLFFDDDGRAARARIVGALERVSISASVLDRYPHELSGGERQRVAIGRALVAEPKLLVCDEITSSLDVSVQASIVNLIGELQREMELGLLFVTHNLALVRTIADDVAVLSEGRIVEYGTAGDVLDSPRHSYTQSLLADTPSLEAAVGAARGV